MMILRIIQITVAAFVFTGIAASMARSPLYAQDTARFFMQRPKLGLGALYRFEEEERYTPYDKTRSTDEKFQESVTLETNGWLYHPNLVEYHLFLEPVWKQEDFRRSPPATDVDPSSDGDTALLAYDVGATLLKRKPLSLNVFANRRTGDIDFSNAPDTDIERQAVGTRLTLTNPTLPVSVAWIHRNLDEDGFYRSEEDRDEARLNVGHHAKRSDTQLNLRYDNADRTTRTAVNATDTTVRTTSTELTNVYFMTDDDSVRLDSQLYHINADYSGLDQTTLDISEDLYWTHSKALLTRYNGDYRRREFGGSVNEEKRLGANLTHILKDRLTTDVGLAAVLNDFSSGSEDLYQSNLDFLYRRPIPWGRVELLAAYDYGVTRRSGNQEILPSDERLTLSIDTETFLSKDNVILSSIVVTDLFGTQVYTENIDYQVQTVGTQVRISRTILGDIAEGQPVIVNYSYRIDTGYDDSRFGQNYRFSLALGSYLKLAYSHRRIDQTILSGQAPYDPLDDTTNALRINLLTRWSDTEFLYDRQDRSNRNSSVTRSISQRIDLRFTRQLILTFSGNIGDRRYTDLDEEEWFYSLGTSLGWMPKRWCHFSLDYLCNDISGDQRDELDSQLAAGVKLRYGVWTAGFDYQLRDQDDKQNGNRLWRQETILSLTRHLW